MRKVRIQYCSDLHLEKRGSFPRIPRRADRLLLLGDIGRPKDKKYRDFLTYCSDNWKWTGVVLGNHEHYYANYHDTVSRAREVTARFKNVQLLERDLHVAEDVTIAGCTLWTPWSNAEENVISYRGRPFTNQLRSIEYTRNVRWLEDVLRRVHAPLVIATHHLPTHKLISKRYQHWPHHMAYASNLDYLFMVNEGLKAWLCGHSHDRLELRHGPVYLGINAGDYADYEQTVELN